MLESVEADWEALAARVGAPPFLRAGWLRAWWDAFGDGQLDVMTVRRGTELAGVLPVRRSGDTVASPTNWHTPLYGPVGIDDAARAELMAKVFEDDPRRVDLSFLDGGGPDLELLQRGAAGRKVESRTVMRSPYVRIEQDWDSYWGNLSRNLRSTVRRCRHRLEDRGAVELEVHDGREQLEELMAEGLELEASGWKAEEGTAILSRPDTRRFYEELSRWAAGAGLLRVAFLRVGGRAVAFNLGFETEKRHYLLKLGHDTSLQHAGPGTVLTAEMVSRSFALGHESYEFLGGEDRYKLRWASGCHDRVRAQAFAPSLAGRLDRLVQTRGRAVARRVVPRRLRRSAA